LTICWFAAKRMLNLGLQTKMSTFLSSAFFKSAQKAELCSA
jgi:hypothetical protein